jgi:Fe-S oxidoreductase
VLYWVGCAGSYDPRNQQVSRAMVQILRAAGVDFAILGEEESCNAEWARRAGEEYLYQMQAEENVEVLKQYRFRRIVTHCPHCFNTLKNEYPQFGVTVSDGAWDVVHHSQFIQELLATGKLELHGHWDGGPSTTLTAPEAVLRRAGWATFHDSCYLGRYNGIYDAPRQVLKALPGMTLAEMERAREQGFCCGGGGAAMWMEHAPGQRVNDVRMDEIESLNPDLVAVACPFCLIMLDEAAAGRGAGDSLVLKDIAEVVAEALQPV